MSALPVRRLETPTPYAVGPVNAYLIELRGQTSFELAERLYQKVTGYERFLAVSEVVAHLDLVVEDGRAVMTERDGLER